MLAMQTSFMEKDFFQGIYMSESNNMTSQMSNLSLYANSTNLSSSSTGFNKTKEQTDRSGSPNWGSGWGQSDPNVDLWNRTPLGNSNVNKGNGFPQSFGGTSFLVVQLQGLMLA